MDDFEKSWATVGWEEVVERNPEVIMIVNYGEVTAEQKREFMMSNPAFAELDAVKNDRFVTLEYVEATPGPPIFWPSRPWPVHFGMNRE